MNLIDSVAQCRRPFIVCDRTNGEAAVLNRRRLRGGKAPLLDHIEVRVPMVPGHGHAAPGEPQTTRMSPRLHHVRGHLVRRGSQIFWRVPHLRGSARSGIVRSRTVIWSFGAAQGVA